MSTFINAQQLAFILDVKKVDARKKMIYAWAASKGEKCKAWTDRGTGEIMNDDYPSAMEVGMLSRYLNLPTLQQSVDDIQANYLTRPATRKYILCDYPEKRILRQTEAGKQQLNLSLPSALSSLLPRSTRETIKDEWKKRFPNVNINIV